MKKMTSVAVLGSRAKREFATIKSIKQNVILQLKCSTE
jgi:hypothetical protein